MGARALLSSNGIWPIPTFETVCSGESFMDKIAYSAVDPLLIIIRFRGETGAVKILRPLQRVRLEWVFF
jgi:hypothetical protein